jgi:hypothetical protein
MPSALPTPADLVKPTTPSTPIRIDRRALSFTFAWARTVRHRDSLPVALVFNFPTKSKVAPIWRKTEAGPTRNELIFRLSRFLLCSIKTPRRGFVRERNYRRE